MAKFGAEVGFFEVGSLNGSDHRALNEALAEYGILIARGLSLSPQELVELTRIFGEPDIHPIESIRLPGTPQIIRFLADFAGQLGPDDLTADDIVGDTAWHSDLTYLAEPSRGALLYAVEVPAHGGDTGFIDTARVYAALPDDVRQRIAGLEVLHSFGDTLTTAPDFEPVVHPIVHRHPPSGHPALNVCPMFARSIVGWSENDSRALLDELASFATQEQFTYFHKWTPRDLVVWDNWRTMHIATGHPKRYRRHMLRTTIRGGTRLAA